MIRFTVEIEAVPALGGLTQNEFGAAVRITGGPVNVHETATAEGATLIGIGIAINAYMRSRGAQDFNCLRGLVPDAILRRAGG